MNSYLRLSTIRQWLALRAIGNQFGYGLRFCAYQGLEFADHVVSSPKGV